MIRQPVRLDIFLDPVCPWCLVGKANLDRALADHPDHPFSVQWHPFQLNPDMPAEGVPKRAWLEARFGGKERVDAVHERLREVARSAGVTLDPDRPQRIPNTLNAHRLIHWAGIEGCQSEVVSRLMRAYWEEGRDIGEMETLAAIAGEAGMDPAATLRLLQSDADADDIAARDADARAKGVSSVPTFLVAQTYVVTGAQPPGLWAQVIAELADREQAQ
ncbi:DsbA family oxidoreductase [Tabrizicola sp. YIM 78059]|uniref:DsbA family oxidoreductase n=1 Tax=Tabrizicola sp. YIM 78059 TaxID=2529861 RepID=UPI0010AA8340|nr:DsbA family oxidoreductase [Tabrizicola sp. YIM 78059]